MHFSSRVQPLFINPLHSFVLYLDHIITSLKWKYVAEGTIPNLLFSAPRTTQSSPKNKKGVRVKTSSEEI